MATSPAHRRAIGLSLWIAVGFALRLTGLDAHSLWHDEGATLFVANADSIVEALEVDRHPPLSFLVFRAWLALVPQTDVMTRLLPALISCATLLLFVKLATSWLSPRAAMWAVALFAVAPFQIWYAQEVRMYTFVGFGAVVALLGAASVDRGSVGLGATLAGLGTMFAVGCHYLGVLIAGTMVVIGGLLWLRGNRRGAWLGIAGVVGCAAWLPWIVTVMPSQMEQPAAFHVHATLRDIAELPVRELIVMGAAMPSVLPILIAGFTWVGLLGAAWAACRRRMQNDLFVACAILSPPMGILVLAVAMPLVFRPNYLIAMSPGVVLGTALGWDLIASRRRWLAAGSWILIAMCAVGTVSLRQENLRDDYRSAVREMVDRWQPGDRVVTVIGPPHRSFEETVRHYLQDRDDITASLIGIEELLAELDHGHHPTRRLHVVFHLRQWTTPMLARLEQHYEPTHSGPLRKWTQYLLLEYR